MAKLFAVISSSAAIVAAWTTSALAQTYPPTTPPPQVGGEQVGRAPADGIAITGYDITIGMLIMVALFVAGALALFAGRRRANEK
jgi:hypothetical protein